MSYLRHVEQMKGKTPSPTDLQIKVQANIDSERRVAELLADLADARRIEISRAGRGTGRSITLFADRFDDSDEISRRIAEVHQRKPCEAKPIAIAPMNRVVVAKLVTPAGIKQTTSKRWPVAKGMPPSIENRHPSELNIDDSYQRSTDTGASQALIKKIATGWDWRMCMPLVVSKRDDGSLWVIDGQHRLAAAKLRGDISFLPCCVGVFGGVADEAAMFVAMNRARRAMNRLDDFHAAVAGGDDEAAQIAGLITGAGFTVSRKTGSQSWVPGEVAFTSAIAKVMRKHGQTVCADALRAMADAFVGQVLNAGSSMFTALTKLQITPPDGYDPARMMRALKTRTQKEWASFLNEVKGGGDERAFQLRQVLLMAYEETPKIAHAE